MAHNNRYKDLSSSNRLQMNDIPGLQYNPYIKHESNKNEERSASPIRSIDQGKKAELFQQDIVKLNEAKIKKQITFSNNQGMMGPFIEIDKTRPAPKNQPMSLGSSSYKMHFSPGKSSNDVPVKLQNNNSMFHSMNSSSTQKGLRHMSNQDALNRSHFLGNSVDYGTNKQPLTISRAKQVSYDKGADYFRFKKNLTTNADRVLNKPGGDFSQTPGGNINSKYEGIRKAASNNFDAHNLTDKGNRAQNATFDYSTHQENLNYNNIPKYHPVSPKHSTGVLDSQLNESESEILKRPVMKGPTGNYDTMKIQRSLGMAPTTNMGYGSMNNELSGSMNNRSSRVIGQSTSQSSLNDPSYHRHKNLNNYGYDPLTGVRKESPSRV